jgi:hypothetical protein
MATQVPSLSLATRSDHRRLWHQVVRVSIALTLIAAAGLKAYYLGVRPIAVAGLLDSRSFMLALVGAELGFAFWLLSGIGSRITWTVALVWFGVQLLVSIVKGMAGETSCGCFGALSMNPWLASLINTVAIAAIVWAPPEHFSIPRTRQLQILAIEACLATALLLADRYGATIAYIAELQALVRGDPVFVDNASRTLGQIPSDRVTRVPFKVKNLSNSTLTLLGARCGCGCAVDGLPMTVDSAETREIVVFLQPSVNDVGQRMVRKAELYIDGGPVPNLRVELRMTADVKGTPQT